MGLGAEPKGLGPPRPAPPLPRALAPPPPAPRGRVGPPAPHALRQVRDSNCGRLLPRRWSEVRSSAAAPLAAAHGLLRGRFKSPYLPGENS